MRLGVRGQLLLPMTVVVLVFVLVCIASAYDAVGRERNALSARLDRIARTLDSTTFPLSPGVLDQMHGLTGADFFVLWSGQVFTTLPGKPTAHDLMLHELEESPDAFGSQAEWAGVPYYVRVRQAPQAHPNAGAIVAILYPVGRWHEAAAAAVRPVLIFGLAGIVLAAGTTLIIAGRLVHRVRVLESQVRKVAAGDFALVPLPARHDELRDLAASINFMTSRLHTLQESLRESERWRLLGQVSGGIGHQLRNGVAGAKLALQLHERESGTKDSEPLQVALRQLELIGVQVQRFLDLGKTSHQALSSCSLAEVVDEAMALVRPRCRHLGVELQSRIGENLPPVHADRALLLQMVLNLLGNAIDACESGGRVEVRLSQEGGAVAAEVLDSGPGPLAAVADQLFDPFFTTKPDGIGLGLTVVRRAAEAYGGSASWRRDDGRTCFRVTIPATPPTPSLA